MKTNGSDQEVEGQVVSPPRESLAMIPDTLTELASHLDEGVAIIRAREQILVAARKASIRMTSPEDWIEFKDRDGRIVCYLQDAGCQRVRPIFGISTFDVGKPEKTALIETGSFMYTIMGSGRSGLTQEVIEGIIGGRASTDDYITRQNPPLKGAAMELAVMKAARANLEGNLVRRLSGLNSVPLEEIIEAYADDKKAQSRFRQGRGFGKREEREQNAAAEQSGEVTAPQCPKCKVEMAFRPAGKNAKSGKPYDAFWGCPNFKSKGCKETVKDAEWRDKLAQESTDHPVVAAEEESQEQPKSNGKPTAGGVEKIGKSGATFLLRMAATSGWTDDELSKAMKKHFAVEDFAELPKDRFEDAKSLIEDGVSPS